MFDQIKIILVNTSHPGNIGAAARAMKNMGLQNLVLVKPKEFPHAEATARAAGADDLLEQAVVVENLTDAISDSHFVVGTSARLRSVAWPLSDPRECIEKIIPRLRDQQKIAFVFGNEQSGLSNEELALCHAHLHIPCNEDFSSLNVAAAVQIVTYELRMSCEQKHNNELNYEIESRPVTADEMKKFFVSLEGCLIHLGYLNPSHPKKLMLRLRRLFNRAIIEENEMNILRGVLNSIVDHTVEKQ